MYYALYYKITINYLHFSQRILRKVMYNSNLQSIKTKSKKICPLTEFQCEPHWGQYGKTITTFIPNFEYLHVN